MLDQIIQHKKKEIESMMLPKQASVPRYSFKSALEKPKRSLALIAEIKRASPSKGVINETADPIMVAKQYLNGRADCLSILTDERFFHGKKSYIELVKRHVKLPVLRKDFIIDEKQIEESVRIGADAILLIGEVLPPSKLHHFYQKAYENELDVIVEVHSDETLLRILDLFQPEIVGVNNRDLTTFQTNVKHTENIIVQIPKETLVISESGIFTPDHIGYVKSLGADGVLVGESLMRSSNQQEAIKRLFGE
ncbi:indole-3-glycerol phosphate synthase TrpC [Bacillus carboniphilus]|uniref:indole-3-glycerol-phosphate synthase n=1 Tax=Bacillus carboniphilus TaxID=86663 RepID=A0ABY9JWH3_9BACI|nr:indole-3-glycerol phosphate synthase TrpC [Bacillus carboniphilus]WLR43734.1 indole-3-glycerol phosphate synthase TrpC [Bacillus carboniphilus]